MSTTVVIGPKTRLGAAVVERLRGTGERVVLIARDDADAHALIDPHVPGAMAEGVDVVGPDLLEQSLVPASETAPIRLVLAALGPVHPGVPAFAEEAAGVTRDLRLVRQVLGTGRPVHVVLVSTVIALAPRDQRRHYGGWKNLVEAEVAALVAARPGSTLSVVYPGRLVEGGSARPTRWLHTSYDRLADVVLSVDPDRVRDRVVGADSRILLLVRSISLAVRSLTGSWGRT